MVIHKMYDEKRRKERVYELLEMVGLNREHANRCLLYTSRCV